MFQPQPASMSFNKNLVILFVTGIGTLYSEIDDILVKPSDAEAKINVTQLPKNQVIDIVNNQSELQVIDDAIEKATNSQSTDAIRLLTDSLLEKKFNLPDQNL
ncbi:hypothetical protein KQX54_021800 [Cotesia glomerata]|uniref:Uncharacterized protein n=1 Tax=Cotesia glomerata TaxID=32391 RepID=A0AAV7J9T8_COTGL|nr:hypothetical protein KQX54_021800 [Cotesia glomerata]